MDIQKLIKNNLIKKKHLNNDPRAINDLKKTLK